MWCHFVTGTIYLGTILFYINQSVTIADIAISNASYIEAQASQDMVTFAKIMCIVVNV